MYGRLNKGDDNNALNTIEKPSLSLWKIWNMSFWLFRIQFSFELQQTNISRIFQATGVEYEVM